MEITGCVCGLSVDSSRVTNTRISGAEKDARFAWERKGLVDIPDGLRWRRRVCRCEETYFTVELPIAALQAIVGGLQDEDVDVTDVLGLLSFEPE